MVLVNLDPCRWALCHHLVISSILLLTRPLVGRINQWGRLLVLLILAAGPVLILCTCPHGSGEVKLGLTRTISKGSHIPQTDILEVAHQLSRKGAG
jgi:hypothetical protein